MVIAFALFWVLAGLTVFFLAMRSGRSRGGHGGPGGGAAGEPKAGQRTIVAGVLAATVFGLVVPALVLAQSGGNRAAVTVGGLHLNAEQQHGRLLFGQSCALCHTLAASSAVGRTGPNLDIRLGSEISTEAGRRALVLNAIAEGRARGLGQMPAQLYQGRDAEAIADYVAAVAGH
jgi:mono/diheme cytochrome c family protein